MQLWFCEKESKGKGDNQKKKKKKNMRRGQKLVEASWELALEFIRATRFT